MEKIGFIKKLGDSDFQVSLLANPHQALRKVGVEIPAATEVKVVRNSKDSVNIVIPAHNAPSTVLSDDELGQLSAGEVIFSIIALGIGAVVVGGGAAIAVLAP